MEAKFKKKAKKAARNSAFPTPPSENRPLEQSFCGASTRTGPPTQGAMEVQNGKVHNKPEACFPAVWEVAMCCNRQSLVLV